MSIKEASLLPHILGTLSTKPELCDTYDNLCEEIKDILSRENLKMHYEDIQKGVDNALDVGENLGILTLSDDLIRIMSKFYKTPKKSITAKKVKVPTRSTKFVTQPHLMAPVDRIKSRGRRRSSRSRGSRSRSRSSRRRPSRRR